MGKGHQTSTQDCCLYSTNHSNKQADYGRAHYIVIEGSNEIPVAVHRYCYKSVAEIPSDSERNDFFSSLGLKGDNIPVCCWFVIHTWRQCLIAILLIEAVVLLE